MRVLCFGAHPDDIEIAMGGTLAKLCNEGSDVLIAVGSIPDNVETRIKESCQLKEYLNVELAFLEEGKGAQIEDVSQYKLVQFCDHLVKEMNPDIIFTHSHSDPHFDHRSMNRAVFSAMRNTQANLLNFFPPIKNGIFNETIKGNFFYNISEYIEIKKTIISIHESQLKGNNRKKWIDDNIDFNKYLGTLHGVQYAEGFQCIKYMT